MYKMPLRSCILCSKLVGSAFSLASIDHDGVSFLSKLEFVVPEVTWTVIVKTCLTCAEDIRKVYEFKNNCLKIKNTILLNVIAQEHDYVKMGTPEHETDVEAFDYYLELSKLEDNINSRSNNSNLKFEAKDSPESPICPPEAKDNSEVSVCVTIPEDGFVEEQDGLIPSPVCNSEGNMSFNKSHGDEEGDMEYECVNDQFIQTEMITDSITPAATSTHKPNSHFLESQDKPKEQENSDSDLMMAAQNLVLMSMCAFNTCPAPALAPPVVYNDYTQPQNDKENLRLTVIKDKAKRKGISKQAPKLKVQMKVTKNNSYALRLKSIEDRIRLNENYLNSSNCTKHQHQPQKEQIKCDHCKKSFQTKELLSRHLKISHKNLAKAPPSLKQQKPQKIKYPFYCNWCDKNFSFKKPLFAHALQEHDMPEESIKPYKCLVCDRRFKISSHLMKHKIRHQSLNQNGGKENHQDQEPGPIRKTSANQKCSECPRQFESAEQLHCHEVLHHKAADKPKYSCQFCNNKEFSSKISFNFHMRRHDGSKTYPCTICSKPFYSNSHLVKHMTTHAPKSKCYYCGKRFLSIEKYKEHLTNVHNVSSGVSRKEEENGSDPSRHAERDSSENSST